MDQWAAFADRDRGLDLNPLCTSRARLHEGRTERCTILLHGITNCPQQWVRFAQTLHDAGGQNVLVPRYPHHGLRDRLNTEALVVVTNAADPALDNRPTAALARRWRQHGADVTEYEFPRSLGLPHDLIDPAHRATGVKSVYPVLLDLVRRAEAGRAAGTPRP